MTRYRLGVRCLLITPPGLDLSVLLTVLADRAVEVDSTSDIGAGVALARVALDRFDFGVAVVPSSHEERSVRLSAIYLEIGVATGRGLPLLVVAASRAAFACIGRADDDQHLSSITRKRSVFSSVYSFTR